MRPEERKLCIANNAGKAKWYKGAKKLGEAMHPTWCMAKPPTPPNALKQYTARHATMRR